jgi:hypothetical protein
VRDSVFIERGGAGIDHIPKAFVEGPYWDLRVQHRLAVTARKRQLLKQTNEAHAKPGAAPSRQHRDPPDLGHAVWPSEEPGTANRPSHRTVVSVPSAGASEAEREVPPGLRTRSDRSPLPRRRQTFGYGTVRRQNGEGMHGVTIVLIQLRGYRHSLLIAEDREAHSDQTGPLPRSLGNLYPHRDAIIHCEG